jgi:hypothetical protein
VGRGNSRLLLTVAVTGCLALASLSAVSTAGAAVTLGQTGEPNAGCAAYLAQTSTGPAPGYAVPDGYGVITSWSYQGFMFGAGSGKLLVWRPTTVANQYILLRKSAQEDFTAGVVRTFPARIPVAPGDLLGMVNPQSCLVGTGVSQDQVRYVTPASEPADGTPQTLSNLVTGARILVSASVEADSDRDDFGDETQDKCVGTAGSANGCPSKVEIDKVKPKSSKKVKATLTVPGAGTLKVGSASDRSLAAAAAKKTVRAVSQTLTSTRIQQVALTLTLTKSARAKLVRSGKLKLKLKAVYTPPGGAPGSDTAKRKLKS